uniref:C2H2-type domain-containing protein n=1 Tax=Knipowitschia caucasica TaxID=637954 RepID=A0AAV2M4W3_KNICA
MSSPAGLVKLVFVERRGSVCRLLSRCDRRGRGSGRRRITTTDTTAAAGGAVSALHWPKILVTARLSAAAEEIFALFDRTIAEYEEELRLCKERQRRQEQLETLRPTVMLYRAAEGLYLPGQSGVACPQAPQILPQSQEIPETPRIKEEPEEQRIKQEEEQLPELDREFSIDCVKTEESSPLQQTALRVGTWGEDSSTQTEWKFYDTKDHEDRKASVNCSCASVETEADGDHTYHAPIRNTGDRSSYAYRCPFCDKVLTSDSKLERHIALHIGAAETEVFVGDHAYHITASRGSSEETQGNCSVTDSGEDQRPPLGCLSEQMETEAYEDHNYQIRNTGDMARDTYVQMPSQNPGPGLNQEVSKTTQVKEEPEEQSIKQLPVPVPESVSVKTEESNGDCMQKEESSLLKQTELRDESQTEDFITEDFIKETLGNSSDTDNDEDWGAPLSWVCVKNWFVKMSAGQTLRVLVTARLSAAAEEIFALFERTIAEYEEELRLCKEKQRRQEQLETLRPRVMLLRADAQRLSRSPDLDLYQKIPETPRIKEEPKEQSIKQEEEQLPEIFRPVPESVSVKTEESSVDCMQKEESSLLQQTELRDKSQTEDFITEDFIKETLGNSSDTDNDEDWGAPLSSVNLQTIMYTRAKTDEAKVGLTQPEGSPEPGAVSEQDANNANERLLIHMEVMMETMRTDIKCEDLEGRSRLNNIRVVGVPEGSEDSRPTVFVAKLLQGLLGLDGEPVLDRAHRTLRPKPKDGELPRPFVWASRIPFGGMLLREF